MRIATLDLGTNTFICLISEVDRAGIIQVFCDEVRVIRLGQEVNKSRQFHPDALRRADECFREFAGLIEKHKAELVKAYATSAARDVTNKAQLIALGAKWGIPIEIISGEREAELTFMGSSDKIQTNSVMVVDIGGGSTELVYGDRTGIKWRQSLDIGSVRLTEKFITSHPISHKEMREMNDFINEQLGLLEAWSPKVAPTKLIAVAGTPTTLATIAMKLPFESSRVHGYVLSLSQISDLTDAMAMLSLEDRIKLAGMEAKRADVLVAGALILKEVCKRFKFVEVEVSIRGLRYGMALEG